MIKSFLLIIILSAYSYSLNKYTIPYAATDTMTKAQFNSNHDTAKAYIDKIIDTINSNVPRYTQNASTHDKVMPYLRVDTIRSNPDVDSLTVEHLDVEGSLELDSVKIVKLMEGIGVEGSPSYSYSGIIVKNISIGDIGDTTQPLDSVFGINIATGKWACKLIITGSTIGGVYKGLCEARIIGDSAMIDTQYPSYYSATNVADKICLIKSTGSQPIIINNNESGVFLGLVFIGKIK